MKLPANRYITVTQHHASQFQNVQNNDFIHKKLHVVQNVGKEVSNNVTIVSCHYLLKSYAVGAHCAGHCSAVLRTCTMSANVAFCEHFPVSVMRAVEASFSFTTCSSRWHWPWWLRLICDGVADSTHSCTGTVRQSVAMSNAILQLRFHEPHGQRFQKHPSFAIFASIFASFGPV